MAASLRTHGTSAVAFLLTLAASAAVARAEETRTVLLMPVAGSAPDALREKVHATLESELKRRGFRVRASAEASEAIARSGGQPCEEAACLWRLVRDSGAWAGVLVGAWRSNWPGAEYRLIGSIVGAAADRRAQQMAELTGPVQEKTAELLRQLLRAYEEEAPVEVQVEGGPRGTSVVVDGRLRGEVPVRTRLRPGTHRVALSRYGQPGWHGELVLEPSERPVHIQVDLSKRPPRVQVTEGAAKLRALRARSQAATEEGEPHAASATEHEGADRAGATVAADGAAEGGSDPLAPAPAVPEAGRPWWAWGGIAALGVAATALGIAAGLEATRSGCQQYDTAGVVCVVQERPRTLPLVGFALGSALSLGGAATLYFVTAP